MTTTNPISKPVVVGTPLIIDTRSLQAPISVTARPGSGGTLLIEVSTSVNAAGAVSGVSSAAVWRAWPGGTVAAITSDTLLGAVTGIRATATTADGIVEVVA